MNQNRLGKRTLFSYAATAIPLAMLGLPLYIYLPTFYAQSAGLSVTLVGLILFLLQTHRCHYRSACRTLQ